MLKSKITAKTFLLAAVLSILFLSVAPVFSQTAQPTAQLNVTGKSADGKDPFIKVNGENSPNESRLISPADISVPAETSAVVSLGKAGQIELSPGTMARITFTENAVTVDLSGGRLRVSSPATADFNVKTADGIIVNDKSGDAVFVTEIIGGATGVNTETGIANVNGVPLSAGNVWTSDPKLKAKFLASMKKNKRFKKNSGRSYLRAALFGAAGFAAIVLIGKAARR